MEDRPARLRLRTWAALPMLLLLTLIGAAPVEAKDAPAGERAAALLSEGKASEALEAAYEALGTDTDNLDLLELASRAAEQADRKDEALWLASIGARAALRTAASGPTPRRLAARTAALDPLPTAERPSLEGYGARLLHIGRLCVKRRLYGNAVDFLTRCAETPAATEAAKELEKLYKKKRTVETILTSGLDVPLRASHRKSAAKIAKEDERHKTWKKAWKIKGDNYTVQTNAGFELGSAVLDAMEQINQQYRAVFNHKRRGGGTARCTIRLYATREEFERHEDVQDETIQGFYSTENYVACFDPRSVGGRFSELWETLFHEAAHQFTRMISAGTIPGWLDEGTAVYFEGTRRQANGRVETNLVHEERLLHLKDVLESGQPTLKQVVSYFEEGSYALDYYPVGGYLVYFFKNYEDEACERVYAPLFEAFMDSYRSGGKHDPFERFVEYFVEKAKQPGIETFDDLVSRFRTWALDLHALQFGPPSRADDLIARAEKQRKHGKLDAARDSYRWALDKRLNDPKALRGLAEVHLARDEEDAALFRYRQLREVALRADEPTEPLSGMDGETASEVASKAMAAIQSIDAVLAKEIIDSDEAFVRGVDDAAGKYAEAGYPRVGLWILDRAINALGGNAKLGARRAALKAEHRVQGRLWRHVPFDADQWVHGDAWRVTPAGLHGTGNDEHPHPCMHREDPPARYRLEATIDIARATGKDPFVALLFGVDEGAEWDAFGTDDEGGMDISRVLTEWKVIKTLPLLSGDVMEPFTLAIEVDYGRVDFFVKGKRVHTHEYAAPSMLGRFGIMLQDLEVAVTNVRIAY